MEMEEQEPLVLCMENTSGEEVMLTIQPHDDFHTFLDKTKQVLGYDIDLTSVTKNQIVQLHDNAYQFLINLELNESTVQGENEDQEYVLDDGTQIRASQIHFDNEDDPLDITLEKLPFVKLNNEQEEEEIDLTNFDTIDYKIVASPVPRVGSSPKRGFISGVPFKLVCNNSASFEAQFAKYLEQSKTYEALSNAKKNKSPRSLIKDNFNDKDEFKYTREEVLNILKDSPVTSIPYEVTDKKHVRKTDPTRMVQKTAAKVVEIEGLVVADKGNKNCFICDLNVTDKVYIFDKEDQKIHRCSPQKKLPTQLKIICDNCLNDNFMPSRMKGPNQFLNSDEYLVIKDNQQYIFQKIKHFKFKNDDRELKKIKKDEFVKVEIGSDGEIVTKPIDNDDALIVNERKDSSSDVEVIEGEPEIDNIIDNLDDADEDVKVYLGKYENSGSSELKCRFCELHFNDIDHVIDHCDFHKHDLEDDVVYPCPLCDYGYPTNKWLKGHIKAAHQKVELSKMESNKSETTLKNDTSDVPNEDTSKPTSDDKIKDGNENQETNDSKVHDMIIKTEVKQECLSSDDEIWIVQTNDDEAAGQLKKILQVANVDKPEEKTNKKNHKCFACSQIFPSAETLSSHKCRRRAQKRKSDDEDEFICIPTQEDFIRRAQGRPRQIDSSSEQQLQKLRKPCKDTSEAQIVTCHNCNESFTSKVRLKFHMQFHESCSLVRADGTYVCASCPRVFASEAQLFDHVHFQHDKRKRWQCPVAGCQKTFYLRATLTKHSRTHTDTRRYVCVTCGKRFLDKQTLDEHGVTHLQIKPYQCHICLKQLTRVSRLRMHVRAHHAPRAPTHVPACAHCDRAFPDAHTAQEHANKSSECVEALSRPVKEEVDTAVQLSPTSGLVRHTVHVIQSPEPSKRIKLQVSTPVAEPLLASLTDEARSIIRVVEIDKAFRCEYCEDVFYTEDGLNKHRVIHKGVKNPFTCHICKVSFATYSRCTTHKTTHGFYKRPASSGNDPTTEVVGYGDFPTVKHFLCEDCGRSYLHWTYLQVHRRMKHPNENFLHKCNQCEMTFPNSWSLAYHRKKLHTKPQDENAKQNIQNYRIPCRDCEEILPNKTALYKHRKKEHSGVAYSNDASAPTHTLVHNRPIWTRRCVPRPSTTVIEVPGANLTMEEINNVINKHDINTEKIIQVTSMSFAKGSTSIVPNSAKALSMLSGVSKTVVFLKSNDGPPFGSFMDSNKCCLMPPARRPIILQRGEHCNIDTAQRLSNINVQLLLQNNTLLEPNQMVQLQINDPNTMK